MLGLGLRRALGVGLGSSLAALHSRAATDLSFAHCEQIESNPLTKRDKLPLFNQIKAEHVLPAVESDLAEYHKNFKALESTLSKDKANFGVVLDF